MEEGVCAVRPGTDVGRHARMLAQVHDAVLSGDTPPAHLRRLVARSWTRARAQGVDPEHGEPAGPLGPDEIERRRVGSPLQRVLPELRSSLTSVAEDARHVMVVTDADGVLLWREGSNRVRHRADALGFTEGVDWSEASVGTNAIGIALAEDAPVQVFAAEHFVRSHHVWTCTACPVHDPRTGELLGVVDVSGPAETIHPTTVALVGTAVKLAEASLWRQHESRLETLRGVAAPLLSGLRGGAGLVVDDHGWVAAVTGMPSIERVAVPRADLPLAVHGVGVCVPEPVPGGWLLRLADTRTLSLGLDLAARPPRAIVGGSTRWVHPLSTRHAELLVLLAHAGATGLDAAALSVALYGDREHLVTVRAEMSRLRRSLGGLLLARPYRIAPEVEVEMPDPGEVALLRESSAPGIRGLATLRR
ncbi:MAG: diguanylate cyclase [Pseudonocardia sp.]|uniref:GAF domain-containing protein n=1 Tax=Pseudonocardia sp. TaxID=60912 RepID=UPI00262C3865|nr:GAF domain-containing protein [Pseudonocardia sp.]MCU1626993.1 diguanylate cyclase [Pseudonocardia sp.]HEV7468982.1 GAF domain-containing protein [Pseudonocardia sp.]